MSLSYCAVVLCIILSSIAVKIYSRTEVISIVMNIPCKAVEYQYVHDTFRRNNYTTYDKFNSSDPLFYPIHYEMKQNVLWNSDYVYCKDTYVLLVYFVNKTDVKRRDVIRQYTKQGMMIEGKRINYVFVVACSPNDADTIQLIQEENSINHDILISLHEDNYPNVTITILDSFMWIRDYCKDVSFIGRIDGDVWINMENLIHYLETVPKEKFFGGRPFRYVYKSGFEYKGFHTIPFDYPPRLWTFNQGGAYVVSRDVVPYINIGTLYMDFLCPVSEDNTIGEILRRAGIEPYGLPKEYVLFQHWFNKNHIPPNIVFQHGIKDIKLFEEVYYNCSKSHDASNNYYDCSTHITDEELSSTNTSQMNIEVLLHSLEHAHDGLLDGRNLHAELATRLHQLARVQLVVRAARRQDLRLLLQREVLIGERRVDVLLVQVQNLVVGDGAGVGEVKHAAAVMQRHLDAHGQQVVQHRHGVGDVHHALVLGDLRHEVARRQIVRDGHAHAQDQHVGVHLLELGVIGNRDTCLLCHRLGVAVEAAGEVGLVLLREPNATAHRVLRIILA